MNTGITTKADIMKVCRGIVARDGLKALNMRAVAGECQIALGTLYNYYCNKDELLMETVESVWKDIFHRNERLFMKSGTSFWEYVNEVFEVLQSGTQEYPDFFSAHSAAIAASQKGKAKSTMDRFFVHMKKGMEEVLENDPEVDQSRFSESFSKTEFLDFIMQHMILFLAEGKKDCGILTEMIRRAVY